MQVRACVCECMCVHVPMHVCVFVCVCMRVCYTWEHFCVRVVCILYLCKPERECWVTWLTTLSYFLEIESNFSEPGVYHFSLND